MTTVLSYGGDVRAGALFEDHVSEVWRRTSHSRSDPALRVVGFQPSLPVYDAMMSEREGALGTSSSGDYSYPRLSSPLSRLLNARGPGGMNDDDTAAASCSFDSHPSCPSDGGIDGRSRGVMSEDEATGSEQRMARENERGHLRLPFDHVVAAPIDIPYNAHGVRHWRR